MIAIGESQRAHHRQRTHWVHTDVDAEESADEEFIPWLRAVAEATII
jgi:hypothetical protein